MILLASTGLYTPALAFVNMEINVPFAKSGGDEFLEEVLKKHSEPRMFKL
jgi:hypothetical protein